MNKKNGGFTLIELLAAIVILGILMAIAAPQIIGLLGKNTNKIYINDAIKLISQAEYQMRASSTEIEKPDNGDCIVMTLAYLDNSDFDTPPNNGEYIKEASFVVVKNDNGNLQYSAMLVEKMKKGGYKGVELTTSENLNASNATKHVVTFDKADLKYITESDKIEAADINNMLKKQTSTSRYVESINNVYNEHKSNSAVVDSSAKAPKITKASISSTSSKDYNSLNAKLNITATDADTSTSELIVKYNIVYGDKEGKYPTSDYTCDATKTDIYNSNCFYYGSQTVNFDFTGKMAYTEGTLPNELKMYVIVVDKEGNYDKRILTYSVHKNTAPDIIASSITKLDSDQFESATAKVQLKVTDDTDSTNTLQVCLADPNHTSSDYCDDNSHYSMYSSIFDTNGYTLYTFKDESGAKLPLDGSTQKLEIHVKDSDGGKTTTTLSYILHKNENPDISDSTLVSSHESYMDMAKYYCNGKTTCDEISGNSLNYNLQLTIKDETPIENLNITLQETNNNWEPLSNQKEISGSYSYMTSTTHTFSGSYDGKKRYLLLTVTDTDGGKTEKKLTYSAVHKNVAPILVKSESSIDSTCPANSSEYCNSSTGGAYNPYTILKVVDDLDDSSNIMIAVSKKSTSSPTYIKYSQSGYETGKNLDIFQSSDYKNDGTAKTIYIYLKDSYGNSSDNDLKATSTNNAQMSYKIYKDQAPTINTAGTYLESDDESFMSSEFYTSGNSLNATLYVEAYDDITSQENLTVSVSGEDASIVSGEKFNWSTHSVKVKFKGSYDGTEKTLKLTITDENGNQKTEEFKYKVYKNQAPVVYNTSLYRTEDPCDDLKYCSNDGTNGSTSIYVRFDVKDDMTSTDNLKVCIAAGDDCTPTTSFDKIFTKKYKETYYYELKLANSYPNDVEDATKDFVIKVKDEDGLINEDYKMTYMVYVNQAPIMSENYPQITSQSSDYNSFNVNYTFKAKDIDDKQTTKSLKYQICYKDDTSKEKCTDSKTLEEDTEITESVNLNPDGSKKYKGQTFEIYAKLTDTNSKTEIRGKEKYTVYKDATPIIQSFSISSAVTGSYSTAEDSITATFVVIDPLDTYSICINDSGETNSCDDSDFLATTYEGSTNDSIKQETYTFKVNSNNLSNIFKSDYSSLDEIPNLYLHVKDSNENITISEAKEYTTCTDNRCNFEYEYASTKTTANAATATEISAETCSGQCYYIKSDGSTNPKNVFSYYNRTLTQKDKIFTNRTCNISTSEYRAACDFYTCFQNKDSSGNITYSKNVIGLTSTAYDTATTYNASNNEIYTCTGYYSGYSSSIDEKTKGITLTSNNQKYCKEAVDKDSGPFAYSSSATDPYRRSIDPS